jgi:peptidase E
MKYYLTSTRHCIENISSFKSLINRATKLIILPVNYHKDYLQCAEDVWNHFDRNPCNKESIFYETVRPFVDAGIDIDNIVVINLYTDNINYVKYKLLLPNTIIYLGGGYPENIVENVLKYDLLKTLKQCEVIVGESAGSMALFKEFFVYPDQDYPEYKRFKGLGLLKKRMTVIPHFDLQNHEILESCHKFFKRRHRAKIYCIKDGGYIVIENNKITEFKDTILLMK